MKTTYFKHDMLRLLSVTLCIITLIPSIAIAQFDDVYYYAEDEIAVQSTHQTSVPSPVEDNTQDTHAQSAQSAQQPQRQNTTGGEDDWESYDFYYTKRIYRFHRPTIVTEIYYYDDDWYWGWHWGLPVWVVEECDPWYYSPWWYRRGWWHHTHHHPHHWHHRRHWWRWYDPWWYDYHVGYWDGYYDGFYDGYYHGYDDGYWGWHYTPWWKSWRDRGHRGGRTTPSTPRNDRPTHYGPRRPKAVPTSTRGPKTASGLRKSSTGTKLTGHTPASNNPKDHKADGVANPKLPTTRPQPTKRHRTPESSPHRPAVQTPTPPSADRPSPRPRVKPNKPSKTDRKPARHIKPLTPKHRATPHRSTPSPKRTVEISRDRSPRTWKPSAPRLPKIRTKRTTPRPQSHYTPKIRPQRLHTRPKRSSSKWARRLKNTAEVMQAIGEVYQETQSIKHRHSSTPRASRSHSSSRSSSHKYRPSSSSRSHRSTSTKSYRPRRSR